MQLLCSSRFSLHCLLLVALAVTCSVNAQSLADLLLKPTDGGSTTILHTTPSDVTTTTITQTDSDGPEIGSMPWLAAAMGKGNVQQSDSGKTFTEAEFRAKVSEQVRKKVAAARQRDEQKAKFLARQTQAEAEQKKRAVQAQLSQEQQTKSSALQQEEQTKQEAKKEEQEKKKVVLQEEKQKEEEADREDRERGIRFFPPPRDSVVISESSGSSGSSSGSSINSKSPRNFRPIKNTLLAKAADVPFNGKFSYAFWIKPLKTAEDWTQLFHKGPGKRDRNPAVFVIPQTFKLHVRSGSSKGWNTGLDTNSLPLNKWTHVVITHQEGSFIVYFDGVISGERELPPPLENNGNLWASGPWYEGANALLADFRYQPDIMNAADIQRIMKQKRYDE